MTASPRIPIRELRNDVARIIKRVELGESIEVTRHGQPVARLVPIAHSRPPLPISELWRLRESVPADPEWAAQVTADRQRDLVRDPYETYQDLGERDSDA